MSIKDMIRNKVAGEIDKYPYLDEEDKRRSTETDQERFEREVKLQPAGEIKTAGEDNYYVDFDDVINDLTGQVTKYINENTDSKKFKASEVDSWDFYNDHFDKETVDAAFMWASRNCKALKNALKALKRLFDARPNTYILSATIEKNQAPKVAWMKENAPWFPEDHILFEQDKSKYNGGTLIDDSPDNINNYEGKTYMVSAPHNADARDDSPAYLVDSLEEAVDVILGTDKEAAINMTLQEVFEKFGDFSDLLKTAGEEEAKTMTKDQLFEAARIVHEVNRHYNKLLMDREDPSWDELDDADKDNRVTLLSETVPDIKKISAKKMHDMWVDQQHKEGWKYGEKYDAKKKHHPCIVSWKELPELEKAKDAMYLAVVKAMTELNFGVDKLMTDKIKEVKVPGGDKVLVNKTAGIRAMCVEKLATERTYTIDAEDHVLDKVEKVLLTGKKLGSLGSSRELSVNWDGDGTDRIKSLKADGKELGKAVRDVTVDTDKSTIDIDDDVALEAVSQKTEKTAASADDYHRILKNQFSEIQAANAKRKEIQDAIAAAKATPMGKLRDFIGVDHPDSVKAMENLVEDSASAAHDAGQKYKSTMKDMIRLKLASFREDHKKPRKKKKFLPEIDKALATDIEKEVAQMMATSHEYKKPAIDAALALVKNYKWERSEIATSRLQGINKPVNQEKVDDMANKIEGAKSVSPFIVVNQLHGIRPQTPGKKILLDGHHRLHACERIDMKTVPVYLGTFTGKAQLPKEELREEVPNEKRAAEEGYGIRNNLHIDKIRAQADERRMVHIKYKDSHGKITERDVEPYKLDIKNNDFWAYDPAKGSIRRFKIRSIKALKKNKQTYEPRWPNETRTPMEVEKVAGLTKFLKKTKKPAKSILDELSSADEAFLEGLEKAEKAGIPDTPVTRVGIQSEIEKVLRQKTAAESNIAQDFIAGLDPTGVSTFRNALGNEKNHGMHKAVGDVGGFVGGAAAGAAVPAALMAGASLALKGKNPGLSKDLKVMARGSMDAYNPKQVARYLKSFGKLNELKTLSGKVTRDANKIMDMGQEIGDNVVKGGKVNVRKAMKAGKQLQKEDIATDVQNLMDNKKKLEAMSKELQEKYYRPKADENLADGISKSMTAMTSLGTAGMTGALNASSAHLQYDTAQKERQAKMQERLDKRAGLASMVREKIAI